MDYRKLLKEIQDLSSCSVEELAEAIVSGEDGDELVRKSDVVDILTKWVTEELEKQKVKLELDVQRLMLNCLHTEVLTNLRYGGL